jgi:tRNA threonylcarbamoyladenosine biosynthesis protein TsaB
VLALDSLLLVADDARARHGAAAHTLWVAMDARMDEVYAAAYRVDGQAWQVEREAALWTLPALADAWRQAPPACIAGSALAVFGARLPTGGALCIRDPADRGAALARLARAAWQRGEAIDAAQALPLYLRDKVALTTAERGILRA